MVEDSEAPEPTERFYREKIHGSYYPPSYVSSTRPHYIEVVRTLLRSSGERHFPALEIGPENPALTRFWTQRLGISQDFVHTVDVSPVIVDLLRREGFHAERLDVSGENLPFETGFFELVIMCEVLEHLVDADRAISEIRRVLSPTGRLILTTPNLAAWFNRFQLLFGFQPIFTETGTEYVFGRGPWVPRGRPVGHLQVYTSTALREFLEYHHFRVRSLRGLRLESGMFTIRAAKLIDPILSQFPAFASGFLVEASREGGLREVA